MHNATVQKLLTTVTPNTNLAIVIMQAEARFFCKRNVVSFLYPGLPFLAPLVAQMPVISSQGKWSNGRLLDIPLCCKRRQMAWAVTEWCVADLMCCAMVQDVSTIFITAIRTICLSSRQGTTRLARLAPSVGRSVLHQAIIFQRHSSLVSFNALIDFYEK